MVEGQGRRHQNRRGSSTPFSLVLRKNILTVHRETLTQNITFKRRGTSTLVLSVLATVISCMDPSVRMVTKSPKVGPLPVFSKSLGIIYNHILLLQCEKRLRMSRRGWCGCWWWWCCWWGRGAPGVRAGTPPPSSPPSAATDAPARRSSWTCQWLSYMLTGRKSRPWTYQWLSYMLTVRALRTLTCQWPSTVHAHRYRNKDVSVTVLHAHR